MPYGYGSLGAGKVGAAFFEGLIADYLSYYATIGSTEWDPGVTMASIVLTPAAVILQPAKEVFSARWSGTVTQTAGLTAVIKVQAIAVTGDGTVQASDVSGGETGSSSGRLRGPVKYYPGLNPPYVGAFPLPAHPWTDAPRIDPNNWSSDGAASSLWAALPCCLSVGGWKTSTGEGTPYIPADSTDTYYNIYPEFQILCAVLQQPKIGLPAAYVPLSWREIPLQDGIPDPLFSWQSARSEAAAIIDALEQGDTQALTAIGGDGTTSWRMGYAHQRRVGLP